MSIRLAIASREPILLYGLERLFEAEGDIALTAACREPAELREAVRDRPSDVVLLDLAPENEEDLALLLALADLPGSPAPVLLVGALRPAALPRLLALGVRGVLLKRMAPRLFVECVRKVHRGERWVERESEGRALEWLIRRESALRELTAREIEVVELVAAGLGNKEIGSRLGISHSTVKVHLRHVFRKLGVNGRVALLRWAEEQGLRQA